MNGATSSYIERLERLVDAGDDLADLAAMTLEEAQRRGQRMMLLERAVSIYREKSKTENALTVIGETHRTTEGK